MSIPAPPPPLVQALEQTIDLWSLPYQREQRRQPLLAVLAHYVERPVAAIPLATGKHGRPELGPPYAGLLDFNWSHSGERAVIALGRGLRLGVDLEHIQHQRSGMDIAQRYFHPDEIAYLHKLDPAAQTSAFFRLWTAKEALLKATGKGIVFGLERLSIALHGKHGLALQSFEGESLADWQLTNLDALPGYALALAWHGGKRELRWRQMPDG